MDGHLWFGLLTLIEGVQFGVIAWLCREQIAVRRHLTIITINLRRHLGAQWTDEVS